jgi:hypothetical protein
MAAVQNSVVVVMSVTVSVQVKGPEMLCANVSLENKQLLLIVKQCGGCVKCVFSFQSYGDKLTIRARHVKFCVHTCTNIV